MPMLHLPLSLLHLPRYNYRHPYWQDCLYCYLNQALVQKPALLYLHLTEVPDYHVIEQKLLKNVLVLDLRLPDLN